MKKYCILFLISMVFSGGLFAEGCEVDYAVRAVICLSDEDFSSDKHGDSFNSIINSDNPFVNQQETAVVDGWGYIQETTAADGFGMAIYSGKWVVNALEFTTSGAASDGVILRNWDPRIDVNSFRAEVSGSSADGINIAREAQNGVVAIYENLNVISRGGMGLRVNIAHYGYQTHNSIISKGSSNIETFASGSNQTGHAVMAGSTRGCGPFGIPFFDCRVVSDAQASIELLGDINTIRTSGNDAAGIFSRAKSFIRVNNVNITSTGNNSSGVRVNRLAGTWYYDQNTQGSYDYSGVVELLGHVAVTASGVDSFAFEVDSLNAAGTDSQGITASIRSFDRTTGQVVTDGIYHVAGNMRAQNAGVIDLTMANQSNFRGATSVNQMLNPGVINLNILGSESVWNMTGNSTLTNLNLKDGAKLEPIGDLSTPTVLSLTGLLENSGVIQLSNGVVGDKLTISPSYSSSNGVLSLDTCLGNSTSLSDQLIVAGNTHGTTRLTIRPVMNAACMGALTEDDGILLVQVSGDSSGVFELDRPSINMGNFAYTLEKKQNNWYLVSTPALARSILPVPIDSYLVIIGLSGLLMVFRLGQMQRARRSARKSNPC